jgi:hypothetical protein
MSILSVAKVQKIYGAGGRQVQALEDISFSVEAGEFVTLFTLTNPDAAQAILTKISPAEFVDAKYGRLFLDSVIDMTKPPADALAKAEFGRNHLEAWEAYQGFLITGQTAAQGALEKPQDLKGFLTNDLVEECNGFDKERIRRMAREWKP